MSGIFSIPTYAYFYDRSIDQIDWGRLQIKLEDGVSKEKQEEIVKDLTAITGNWQVKVEETYKQIKSMEKIQAMLDIIFNGCIAVMMFLCFFSLSASMSANLYEQTKEIGVLRSIGLTSF